jgi:hypothetical protein
MLTGVKMLLHSSVISCDRIFGEQRGMSIIDGLLAAAVLRKRSKICRRVERYGCQTKRKPKAQGTAAAGCSRPKADGVRVSAMTAAAAAAAAAAVEQQRWDSAPESKMQHISLMM